jgi:hypothetical protein
MSLDKSDALAIAKKLKATIVPRSRHDFAQFWYQDKMIFSFGIGRGKSGLYDYIPRQMFLSPRQCRDFRDCTMTLDQVIALLKDKNMISPD